MSLFTTCVANDGPTSRALVMLHGIYGRGRNWQGIARAVIEARRDYACWLVDLPHHGDSSAGTHGDTVRGLSADVAAWLEAENIHADALLGHSYGGKVALAMAAELPPGALQVWVIDSTPEVKPPSGSAWRMLEIIEAQPAQFHSRDSLISAIVAGGFPSGVAQWMATNLVRSDQGFKWRLDFDAMERLLQDFFTADLWPVVAEPKEGQELHFVKASESSAMSDDAASRIESAAHPRVHLHRVQGGHWIHAESPEVVTALLVRYLPD